MNLFTKEIHRTESFLWSEKILTYLGHFPEFRVNKCPPLVPILGQMNPVYTSSLPSFTFKMCFKITPPYTPKYLETDFAYISEAVIKISFKFPKVGFFNASYAFQYSLQKHVQGLRYGWKFDHSGECYLIDG
jgi:hypothetical protein